MQFRQAITTTLLAALVAIGTPGATAHAQSDPDPNSARPRMLTPGIPGLPGTQFQIFQRSPDGTRLRVRIDRASFIANGATPQLASFTFAVQYAMQRWNEIGGAGPRMVFDSTPGHSFGELGIINVFMVPTGSRLGASGLGLPFGVDAFSGAAWGGTVSLTPGAWTDHITGSNGIDGGGSIIDIVMHEMGHALGLGHSCRGVVQGVVVGTSGPICNCSAGSIGGAERAIMAGMTCSGSGVTYDHLHGPSAEDITALRSANGSLLGRLNLDQWHHMTPRTSDGDMWNPQDDNFPWGMASTPAVAANSGLAPDGQFALAWRDSDAFDKLNTVYGFTNNWFLDTRFTFNVGDIGVRGQPALTTDGAGNYVVAFIATDKNNSGWSNSRNLLYAVFSPYLGRTSFLNTDSTSTESPALAYVEPAAGKGFWVMAFAGRTQAEILLRIAPHTDPGRLPTSLKWSDEIHVRVPSSTGSGTATIGVLGGLSLACNPSALDGADVGRCLISFATDGHRSDEAAGQAGFLRTLSFQVSPTGGVSRGFSLLGFSSGHRTAGTTAMAYNTAAATWHLAVSHFDAGCWLWNKMPAGGSLWPALQCPIPSADIHPIVSPSLVYSPFWGEVQYYHPG